MRLISFAITTQQVIDRTKTVTRRLGWRNLKVGERLQACEKVMGRMGQPLKRVAVIEVVDVRREPLNRLTGGSYTDRMAKRECIAEGFPDLSARQFVEMFCEEMGCTPGVEVTRIQFKYV